MNLRPKEKTMCVSGSKSQKVKNVFVVYMMGIGKQYDQRKKSLPLENV